MSSGGRLALRSPSRSSSSRFGSFGLSSLASLGAASASASAGAAAGLVGDFAAFAVLLGSDAGAAAGAAQPARHRPMVEIRVSALARVFRRTLAMLSMLSFGRSTRCGDALLFYGSRDHREK